MRRNCELVVLLLTALACGPECWSLSQGSETESQDTQGHRLGPDLELEEGKCSVVETGGNLVPESKPDGELEHGGGLDEERGEENFGMIEKPAQPSALSLATSMFSKATSKIYNGASEFAETAKNKIYDGATNVASDFAEKVREVFHEEMYGFLESLLGKVGDLVFSPGE